MTYSESIRYLYDLRLHGLKLGLENSLRLSGLMGRPQDQLRFIHVAGTNGKGSTCAMLESIYRTAGFRVGLYTSPHLVSFRERIQVDRSWITEAEVRRGVDRLRDCLDAFPTDQQPTFFEVVTALALMHFAAHRCDLVIWETGMGGRLDATNIVLPLASLITNVELDHQKWLGSTRAEIAAEKAGIIKQGIPAVTACDHLEALTVLRQTATQRLAPLTVLPPGDAVRDLLPPTLRIPLPGPHQLRNAALAATAVRQLDPILPVDTSALHRGLEQVDWPGRMQMVRPRPDAHWILDGAHNPAGMQALLLGLEVEYPRRRPVFVLGVLCDKDYQAILNLVGAVASRLVCVPIRSARSTDPRVLAEDCARRFPDLLVECLDSVAAALRLLEKEVFVVVTGSLYLVGEAMESLGLSRASDEREPALNDWSAADPQPLGVRDP